MDNTLRNLRKWVFITCTILGTLANVVQKEAFDLAYLLLILFLNATVWALIVGALFAVINYFAEK